MDIALIVDKLVPGAEYARSDDYAALAATWTDARAVPTEAAIIAAEAGVIADQADRDAMPSSWECIEALLALNADTSLDALKAQIMAAKAAGVML